MTRYRKAGALLLALGIVAAACGDDDDDGGAARPPKRRRHRGAATEAPATEAPADRAPREQCRGPAAAASASATATTFDPADLGATLTDGEYGETYYPIRRRLIVTGMAGPAGLPGEERARNIVLATVARAGMPVDEDLAMKCWQENGCDTGTGGALKVGLADGFGGNIARQIFKMEFILQALTYPEIGEIGYTDANLDTQKAISDVRSFAARDFDIIISYPDAGEALVPAYRAAMERGLEGRHLVGYHGRRARRGLLHLQRSRRVRHRHGMGHAVRRGAARRRRHRDPPRCAGQHARRAAGGLHERRRCPPTSTSSPGRATPGAVRATSRRCRRSSPSIPTSTACSGATAMRSSARCAPTRQPGSRWTASSRCTSRTTTRSCAPGRTPAV